MALALGGLPPQGALTSRRLLLDQPAKASTIRDQGENTSAAAGPSQSEVMHALITGWRRDWGQGEFPWVFIQKPSGGGCAWDPDAPLHRGAMPFAALPEKPPGLNDGRYREHFLRILETPNTAMAVTSDLSPGVHPPSKSAYGARAAKAALALAYGRKLAIYGPLYAGHEVDGAQVRIRFHHTGQGLAFKGGDQLQGFMLAGADRKFHWAEARIDGDTVVVSSPAVAAPAAVRYAWHDKCPWANLFNRDGLPAQCFRTDDW
jgi:sialate O-acetylesterase